MSKTTYCQFDWGSSRFYHYAATQINEDYEEHKNKAGKISYRKYFNQGVSGELLNLGVMPSKFGDNLMISVKNENGYHKMQLSLYDQSGMVTDDYVESVITRLGNLEKGKVYTFFPYNLSAEDQREFAESTEGVVVKEKYYEKRAMSIKHNGEAIKMSLTYEEGQPNSIPRVVWKDNPTKPGSKKPSMASVEAKSDFLLAYLMEAVNGHLKYDGGNGGSSSSSSSSTSTPTPSSADTQLADSNAAMAETLDLTRLPF